MLTGTIKRFDTERGFGFIRCPSTHSDVFFHITGLAEAFLPAEGQEVEFTLGQDRQGRERAEGVRQI